MLAFLQSLAGPVLKYVIKMAGNSVGMGLPIGEIVIDCWEGHWKRKSEAELQQAIAQVAQGQKESKQQVALLINQIAANQPEAIKQQVAAYLNMVPAAIQRSLRRPDDLSGRTMPSHLRIRGPADLQQFLPDRLPRFKIGDRPLAGMDLVLEKFIGMGGFGEVWKATHQSRPNAPPVALKFCTDVAAAKSLHREVELLDRVTANKGRLKNIVELKYSHLQADPPCLEYEYVSGGDLAELLCDLRQNNKATPNMIAQIMLQLTGAVASAHDIQPPIIHRDLKPANVLVQRTGGKISLKVADFGIGGVASHLALEEAQHATVGTTTTQAFTPLYASPQQRSGQSADPRDDVYALGVMWYQLLIGDLRSEAPRGSAWKRRLAELGMSADLIALLEECVEDHAEDRPKNAVVVAKQLKEQLNTWQEPPKIQSQKVYQQQHEKVQKPTSEKARKSDQPIRANSYFEHGLDCFKHDQYQDAILEFTKAIGLDPTLSLAFTFRGLSFHETKEYDQAINDFDRAIQLDNQQNPVPFVFRAGSYLEKEEYDSAIEDCDRAIDLDITSAPSEVVYRLYSTRGRAYYETTTYSIAAEDFTKAIRCDPSKWQTYYWRARAYDKNMNDRQAIKSYGEVVRLNPEHVDALMSLGWYLATSRNDELRDGKRAFGYAKKACELTQWQDSACIEVLAAALAESRDFKQALIWQQKAIDLGSVDDMTKRRLWLYQNGKPYQGPEHKPLRHE